MEYSVLREIVSFIMDTHGTRRKCCFLPITSQYILCMYDVAVSRLRWVFVYADLLGVTVHRTVYYTDGGR